MPTDTLQAYRHFGRFPLCCLRKARERAKQPQKITDIVQGLGLAPRQTGGLSEEAGAPGLWALQGAVLWLLLLLKQQRPRNSSVQRSVSLWLSLAEGVGDPAGGGRPLALKTRRITVYPCEFRVCILKIMRQGAADL